ncbi:MAG: hypothetical protein IKZ87_02935, partial [Actinomycetaceae bacterium]|nr:hypothetical protein [Actinomycetaceae bacterium]
DWYDFRSSNHVFPHVCGVFDCILPSAVDESHFHFMTAVSGWLDAWPPFFYIYLYWGAVAVIVLFALFIDVKKTLLVTLFVDIVYVVSSVVLTISWVDIFGGSIWQGRYALPFVIPYLIVIVSVISQSQRISPTLYRWLTRIASFILSLLFFFFALNITLRFWSGYDNGIDIWHGPLYAPMHAKIGLLLVTVASAALVAGIWYATRSLQDVPVAAQLPAQQDARTEPISTQNAETTEDFGKDRIVS